MIHLFPVLNVLSVVILVFALVMGVPLLASYAFDDAAFWAFDQSMAITAAVGVALHIFDLQTNVVVWSGDPFEFTTGVERVFIRGREIPARSRQTELLQRYKTLPPKY